MSSPPDPLTLIDASLDDVRAAVIAEGERQTGLRNRSPVGILRGIWETLALVVRRVYAAHIRPMYATADRSRATGPWLDLHARYLSVRRKAAHAAAGHVTALSAITTVTIAAGTELATAASTGVRLVVTAETELPAGVAVQVPVRAAEAGVRGNIVPGTATASEDWPAVTWSLAADWLSQPGSDEEADAALRRRIDDRWRSLGDGYPPPQYRYLAESVAGVRRAIVVRTPRGFGSADLVVIAEGGTGVPSHALLDAVTAAIEDHRMICRDLRVRGGSIVPIAVSVLWEGGGYSDAAVAAAIEQGLADATADGVVRVADIYGAAVKMLPGLSYFGVAAPLHDVTIGAGSLPDLTVTAAEGRAPATHVPSGGTSTGSGSGSGPEPITASLPYGVLAGDGTLVPQAPQAPVASGRWTLTLPALSAGQTWYLGPLPAGVRLTGIESYSASILSDWSQRAADGVWIYSTSAAALVPAGVLMDAEVTAERTS